MSGITDATLTKIDKNRILKLALEYGPPANDFQWTETEQTSTMTKGPFRVSVLTHRPTGYYCIFGVHGITTCPGLNKKVQYFSHDDLWEKKENACGKWLVVVKGEVEAPDLWAAIVQERVLPLAATATSDNRPFTAAETHLSHTKLDEIKTFLLEGQDYTTGQFEMIEREFSYLRESSRRLGRKDWLNVALGGLVSLAINLALDPEKARGLLGLAGSAFQSLWNVAQGFLQ